ncbi:hypothetical protein BJX66DRAFT_307344 [Aspergillus keveii]|jgi:hypothetical protein|uniref:Secreted protein n=1 Tax=Aspergillus keveii TaxID=714993 RepID=A0ABR4G1M0_9EURO
MTFLLSCCVSWRLILMMIFNLSNSCAWQATDYLPLHSKSFPAPLRITSRDPRVMGKILANDFLRKCVQQLTIEVREISRFDYPNV